MSMSMFIRMRRTINIKNHRAIVYIMKIKKKEKNAVHPMTNLNKISKKKRDEI